MELLDLLDDRDWMLRANCAGVDPDLFFPERGKITREASTDPRAVYMRRYREEVRQGVQKAPRAIKISSKEIEWARSQRDLGRTYRSIATELGVDYSYLARRVKRG